MYCYTEETPVYVRAYRRFRFEKWENVIVHYRAKYGSRKMNHT